MTAYDPNNPFAKILRGEFPCYKVYEDDHVLAFLDIMPRCPGHTLVIPKAPARNILDISAEDFAHVARGGHRIARAAMTAFKADGITVQQFNEPAGGQVVFHLHMHVMPRHNGVALLPPASRKEDGKVLDANTAKLMEDNPLLVRLKELETLEKIADKVDKITVVGGLNSLLERTVTIAS